MNNFIYNIPTKVYFGRDELKNLAKELSVYGKRVLLVYGGGSIKKNGLYDRITAEIKNAGLQLFELAGVEPNPKVESVNAGADICKKEDIDVVLAVGGGSVIDCSKFIAAAKFYDGDAWDIVLRKVEVKECLPLITVLTMAATGSEMDCIGVISNVKTKEKIGAGFAPMQPKVSFLDPSNTFSVGRFQTASGSADILSHIIEVYFNLNDNFTMLNRVMEGLMKTVIEYAPIALEKPNDYEARANLMWASSWAINGFIKAGKQNAWSCHPIEHQLSAYYDIAHGLGLAILTPRWMKYILNENTVDKFYDFGVNVFAILPSDDKMSVAKKSIECLEEFLFKTLKLKSTLSKINIDETHFADMAKKANKNNALQKAVVPLNEEDVVNILQMCL